MLGLRKTRAGENNKKPAGRRRSRKTTKPAGAPALQGLKGKKSWRFEHDFWGINFWSWSASNQDCYRREKWCAGAGGARIKTGYNRPNGHGSCRGGEKS